MFYGEWLRDGNELILPDVLEGRLLRFDRAGNHLGSAIQPEHDQSKLYRPIEVRTKGRELILNDRDERIVRLRHDLTPVWDVELPDVRFPGGDRVGRFRSFIVSGEELLGMTVVIDETGRERWSGISRMRLGNSPVLERLVALPSINTPEGNLYFSHPGPYLANAGGATYVLLFGDDAHLEMVLPARRRLRAFPAGYRSPVVPMATGPSSLAAWDHAWQLSTSPVALFGRGAFLYLLTRRPHGEGSTQWMLHQIDPVRDEMMRAIELPTGASEVVVVPGPLDWAIVEKGPLSVVRGLPDQVIASAVFVPTTRIEDRNAPPDLSRCVSSRR